MFGRNTSRTPQKRIDRLIGAGTTVVGDITFVGGVRVDGAVKGKISTADSQPGTLVISEQARVEGEVRVSHVVVNGAVNGPLTANDYLELQSKARVNGDVVYRTLEMHVGAIVHGKLMHAEPETGAVVELKRATGD